MNPTVILSFLAFTGFVLLYTLWKMRGSRCNTRDGYFLGGRSLTGGRIAGSLILTNLGAISFVGMSAQSYTHNMSVMGWEIIAGITLVPVALLLIPLYLKQGIATIPDFLESRYDSGVRKFVTILFLFQYIINILPTTLYAGARVLGEMLDLQHLFGISEFASVALISAAICLPGFFYSVFGGLKAVVIADSVNGIGLLIGGLMIPVFGILALDDHFGEGLQQLLTVAPEKLQSIGSTSDPLPFSTLFSGLLLVNLYYWGTDQSIIQRTLGARNLAEGQKGVLLAAGIKLFTPLVLIIPGIIAFHLFGAHAGNPDSMYIRLVHTVLPRPLIGFFTAVMFGAVLSTFNGVLNASTTLFTLNIYKPLFGKDKEDRQLVREGRFFAAIIAVISTLIAPFILFVPEGLFQYLQMVAGFFSVPVFTIVFVGYVSKRVPPIAAKIALTVFVSSYALMQLVFKTPLHFLHQLGLLFVICSGLMFVIGAVRPRTSDYILPLNHAVDTTPWKHRHIAAATILYLAAGVYLLFSDLGLLSGTPLPLTVYGGLGLILLGFSVFWEIKR
ncbi:solute:sodium symporter family transporter [Verrucomicrobia bacterium S94]|nr:solute:sodium symporter family transporter [Verrucomicrobia bacterium S94]